MFLRKWPSSKSFEERQDINARYLDFPDGWYDLNQDPSEKLTELQHICLKICIEINRETLSETDKPFYKEQIESLIQQGADLTVRHHSFCNAFTNTVFLEALSCEGGKDEWLADTLIDLAVKYRKTGILTLCNGNDGPYKNEPRFSSPLIFALKCARSNSLIVKLIKNIPRKERFSALNMKDSKGYTALHYACYCGHNEAWFTRSQTNNK